MNPLPAPCRSTRNRAGPPRVVAAPCERGAPAAPARGGVDVDDRRVDPLGDVGETDQAGGDTGRGWSCDGDSRTGAVDTTGVRVTPPARMTPTRNAATRTTPA